MWWRFTHWCVFEHFIAMTLELSVDMPSRYSWTFHMFRWFCHFTSLDLLRLDVQWRLWWQSKLSDDLVRIVVYGDWAGSSCCRHTDPKRWNNPKIAMPDVLDRLQSWHEKEKWKRSGEGNSPMAAHSNPLWSIPFLIRLMQSMDVSRIDGVRERFTKWEKIKWKFHCVLPSGGRLSFILGRYANLHNWNMLLSHEIPKTQRYISIFEVILSDENWALRERGFPL